MGLKLIKKDNKADIKPKELQKPEPKPTDDELAAMLMAELGEDYAFWCDEWWHYDDGVWSPVKTISRISRDVLIANKHRSIKPTKALAQSIEWFASLDVEVPESDVDSYYQYLNLSNGLLNLETFELEPHRRDTYLTKQLDYEYNPDAECPTWIEFISSVLVDPDDNEIDPEMVALFQEAAGYTLTADTHHRVSFWLYGSSATGKSTAVNALSGVLNAYHATVNLNELGTNKYMLASIQGARMVSCGEMNAHIKLDDGAYKILVSDDEVYADVKYKDAITFKPRCKVWWAMNNLPYVSDRSGAVNNRILIIPFHRAFERYEWDFELSSKLHDERPGILNWMLHGLDRLRRQGRFTYSEQVELATEDMQQTNDVYALFLADDEWVNPQGRTKPLHLYKAFSAWAEERGIKKHASFRNIGTEWKRLGLVAGNSAGRYYEPVSLVGTGSTFDRE